MTVVRIAVPRKGRPLEAVLERIAARANRTALADDIVSTLRYEKAIAKGEQEADRSVYERLARYSETADPTHPEYTLLRDDRESMPRRIVFDSVTIPTETVDLHLVGREEPFRALRKHEFALGFDSADLVLEEVVGLNPDPLAELSTVNERIDPRDTDVRLQAGLGDTVYHTLLATPDTANTIDRPLDRSFVDAYEGDLCVSPRYERLVEAVLGTTATENVTFRHPDCGQTEEAAIAATGLGVYLTVSGSTAREHGLVVGQQLFPSETVLLENVAERTAVTDRAATVLDEVGVETSLPTQ
ncbi:hypothetical protein Hrd1104_06490 [Halorhabdus sp. CBA1104]|uniref:hypothetical protein n=1 Tax=Halorhabdus sp. CBA1104 TaxID=1380432 RepID=UPI0012B32A8F|nr:hypothetical protein [Halorhabdus sp. CBA1104]QGN06976.1 hypothetical protein Hrd1104_06490 [Halorhabdus sp. CBA1104]